MAMLAAPRRKQKVINLRAKNSEWSNDTNKFGQRMLEKMGWSSGKGLGAKEDGMVEHVVARYKNDEKGLGFEDKNDQWTKHEDDFNALLSNLSNGDNKEEKLHSGVSLEVKSKKSKARVHYHKFTRGKDLTRYSEKDLANIFGKKSLKNEENITEPVNEEVQSCERIFTEKGSMEDYFKNKLAAIKSKKEIPEISKCNKEDYETEYSFQGFSETTNENADEEEQNNVGFHGFSFYNTKPIVDDEQTQTNLVKKKKKKSKKCVEVSENQETESEVCKNDFEDHVNEIGVKPTKKKKSKISKEGKEIGPENEKTRKNNEIEILPDNEVNEINYVPKKKKKRKNKNNEL